MLVNLCIIYLDKQDLSRSFQIVQILLQIFARPPLFVLTTINTVRISYRPIGQVIPCCIRRTYERTSRAFHLFLLLLLLAIFGKQWNLLSVQTYIHRRLARNTQVELRDLDRILISPSFIPDLARKNKERDDDDQKSSMQYIELID